MTTVDLALSAALAASDGIERAREEHRDCVTRFIFEARRARWTWAEIGAALRVTDVGARRFYYRNRGRLLEA
jgi:hypothetical protein